MRATLDMMAVNDGETSEKQGGVHIIMGCPKCTDSIFEVNKCYTSQETDFPFLLQNCKKQKKINTMNMESLGVTDTLNCAILHSNIYRFLTRS